MSDALVERERDHPTTQNVPLISLLSLPLPAAAAVLPHSPKNHYSAAMATPPLHALASVPFKWEEQPGKPRQLQYSEPKSSSVFVLPPCPRMAKTSPPGGGQEVNVGRRISSSFRFLRRERSFELYSTNSSSASSDDCCIGHAASAGQSHRHRVVAGFWGRKSWRFSIGGKVVMRRNASFSGTVSDESTPSRILDGIYEGLKQKVLAWKAKKSKTELKIKN